MATKRTVSPWLRGLLYLVAVLVLPTSVIQLVRPDALDPHSRRPTLLSFRFRVLMDTGIVLDHMQRLHRADLAIAKFRDAEQLAEQMPDGYESLQEARGHLAESYTRMGRSDEAEQAYADIVKSSMDAGEFFLARQQYDAAIPKFEDAERFSQKLTTNRLASTLLAERRLASCLAALKRGQELEPVYLRIITTLRERANPNDLELGTAYQGLAQTRSMLNNWSGAEEALLQVDNVYDQILHHSPETDDQMVQQAARQKDFLTWTLALCYYNEKKSDLALSSAERAFQVLSQRDGPRSVPIGVYTVGLRAATDLQNQEQIQVWRQRLSDLSPNRP